MKTISIQDYTWQNKISLSEFKKKHDSFKILKNVFQ